MYFRKPVVLLLGGLVTASAIGCSAASALFTDQRPKQSIRQSSSDRMVAIGRMFEEQGQLDRAEAMYRGALRKDGRSQEARQLLSDVQTRRRTPQSAAVAATGRPARATGAPANAVARAAQTPQPAGKSPATAVSTVSQTTTLPKDATPAPAQTPVKPVSRLKDVATGNPPAAPPASPVAGQQPSPGTSPVPAAQQAVTPELTSKGGGEQPGGKAVEVSGPGRAPAAERAPTSETPTPTATPTPTPSTAATPKTTPPAVSLEDVLSVADSPAENSSLLVECLRSGESADARCLAAALLGECSGSDSQVSAVLRESGRTTDDCCLLLAVLDSQQQLGALDADTVKNLLRLLPGCEPAVQVQGVTTLRHCSTLSCREDCVSTLTGLLGSSHAEVRAAAALTLSDFRPLSGETLKRLETLSADDSSAEVRESAAASLARGLK